MDSYRRAPECLPHRKKQNLQARKGLPLCPLHKYFMAEYGSDIEGEADSAAEEEAEAEEQGRRGRGR